MASHESIESAILKVFRISELTHLICARGTIRKRDNVNLMKVCRSLFYSILPLVWENFDRPDLLVSMIPGGGIVSYESEVSPYVVMQLPSSLDLLRFNIYAPYIKRLTLAHVDVDAYDNWERFHFCARPVDLLPNLESIHFPTPHIGESPSFEKLDINLINWAIAFLSTPLKTLAQVPLWILRPIENAHIRWLGFDSLNSLMISVAQKCPHLCSLNVLPAAVKSAGLIHRPGNKNNLQVLFLSGSPEIYSSFAQFGNLTSLLISAVILCPEGITALSGLPRLELLRVIGWERDYSTYGDRIQLGTKAFPALKHLELNRLTWTTILCLCNAKPLVAGLQFLTIAFPHSPSNIILGYGAERAPNIFDIIALLAIHSSGIKTLAVYDYEYYQPFYRIPNTRSRLPLVNLHLGGTIFGRCNEAYTLFSILSYFPLLEHLQLNMDLFPYELNQMRKIVEVLPCLRHIQIPVDWKSIIELTEADFIPCQSQTNSLLHVKSNFSLPRSPVREYAKQIARYLSILRPTASVICESPQVSFYQPHPTIPVYFHLPLINMINSELSRLRLN